MALRSPPPQLPHKRTRPLSASQSGSGGCGSKRRLTESSSRPSLRCHTRGASDPQTRASDGAPICPLLPAAGARPVLSERSRSRSRRILPQPRRWTRARHASRNARSVGEAGGRGAPGRQRFRRAAPAAVP